MKQVKWMTAVFCLFIGSACHDNKGVDPIEKGVLINTDFKTGNEGWSADFTDYALEDGINFVAAYRSLPSPLDPSKKSLMVSSRNSSDDVFMFIKRKISGLKPTTDYKLQVELELASKYADNSVGAGGSPGSSVYLKVGASGIEPIKVKQGDNYRLNLDKGNQAEGGKDLIIIGNIGAGIDVNKYTLIKRDNKSKLFTARTNEAGELWVMIGTDSGYEGETTVYYNHIKVTTL